jgi:hypothetical protein
MTTPPNAGQEEITDLTRAIIARRKAIREDLERARALLNCKQALGKTLEQMESKQLLIERDFNQLAWRLIERAIQRLDQ